MTHWKSSGGPVDHRGVLSNKRLLLTQGHILGARCVRVTYRGEQLKRRNVWVHT
jgi:hypothetical protein